MWTEYANRDLFKVALDARGSSFLRILAQLVCFEGAQSSRCLREIVVETHTDLRLLQALSHAFKESLRKEFAVHGALVDADNVGLSLNFLLKLHDFFLLLQTFFGPIQSLCRHRISNLNRFILLHAKKHTVLLL